MTKQVRFFKLPEQESEANDFLSKCMPEAVSANGNAIIVNYDDGSKNDDYKKLEITMAIESQKAEIINNGVFLRTAKHYLEKYVKLLEELNSTIISESEGKKKYDLSKDREVKIAEFKKEITNCEIQIASFISKIEQAEVKIAIWTEELNKLV